MNINKWRITLLILVVTGIGGYWFIAIPAKSIPKGSESKARFTPGPYKVISETFETVDESRATQAYNDFPGSPVRVLKGKIWHPADRRPGPLVIYSHGFMSFHQDGLYLIRFLASHGHTVVASDYPLTGYHAPDKSLMTDVVNQPGDISYLIDTLLKRNADPEDTLHDTIEPTKIAVAGVSLGGLTSTLTAFHPRMRDPRLAAAISIAGPSSMFTPDFFAGSDLPYLMIHGDSDAVVPLEDNAKLILQMYPGAILVTLKNASHAGFAQPASTLMRFLKNPDAFGCRAIRDELSVELITQNEAFLSLLGDAGDGVKLNGQIEICTSPLIPVTMRASRQHMFTALASHAFLDSVFADDAATRDTSRRYLLMQLAEENNSEVSVIQSQFLAQQKVDLRAGGHDQ